MDRQKEKIGKANERKGKVKRGKDGQGGKRGAPAPSATLGLLYVVCVYILSLIQNVCVYVRVCACACLCFLRTLMA